MSCLDARNLRTGHVVSDLNGYYDSQNVVRSEPGAPLTVVLHRSPNREGGLGLQLFSTQSSDGGRIWSELKPIEACDDSPPRCTHDGYQLVWKKRIYVFYGFNKHGLTHDADGVRMSRNDMQLEDGYFVRWSDDHGASWSTKRVTIPVRRTSIDRSNPWAGRIIGMFMCDKPQVIDGAVYFAFQKTADALGETVPSEAFFLKSSDFLDNPETASWETLPEGDVGLQSPQGALGEEPHIISLQTAGRLFALWRSQQGMLGCSYSSNGGRSWERPFWMTYDGTPHGRVLKNPRGAITPCKLRDGCYVLCFYNNGRTDREGYVGRRILWWTLGKRYLTTSGVEALRWAQPEILLYYHGPVLDQREDWNADWAIVDGPGYIDWWEETDDIGNHVLQFVESNKLAVRLHVVPNNTLLALKNQLLGFSRPVATPVFTWLAAEDATQQRGPVLPDISVGAGFTLHAVLTRAMVMLLRSSCRETATLVDATCEVVAAMDEDECRGTIVKGVAIYFDPLEGGFMLSASDGWGGSFTVRTDPLQLPDAGEGHEKDGHSLHHVCFMVDGAAAVASSTWDTQLCDGAHVRPQGWVKIQSSMQGELGGSTWRFLRTDADAGFFVTKFEIYDRALLTSEALAFAFATS